MKKLLSVLLTLIFTAGVGSSVCFGRSISIRNKWDFFDFVEEVEGGNSFKGDVVRLKTDLNISELWKDFVSIGNIERPFCGIFNGKRRIIDLEINCPERSQVGLFAQTIGATFYNLNLRGKIVGRSEVGGFAGRAFDTSFYNCSSEISVLGESYVGGFAGLAGNVYFNSCTNLGNILSTRRFVDAFSGYCRLKNGYSTERLVNCINYGELCCDPYYYLK